MKLIDYLKDKIVNIVFVLATIFFSLFLLIMFNTNILLKVYIPVSFLLCYIVLLFYDYSKRKKYYDRLFNLLDSIDKKILITEIIDNGNFIDANIFSSILYEINKSYLDSINVYQNSTSEFKEYLELWCHEIKTPIATTNLVIENNKSRVTFNIKEEIDKIENYVEQMLFYARSENVYQDYIINKVDIDNVIGDVINRNKKDIMSKKIKINFNKHKTFVESDQKWLIFIINQIVSNSIKYSIESDAFISFDIKNNLNNVIVRIIDNGIGIKRDELDKVFNKGFTGTNGRMLYNSTGIGLYLCKKLCDKLGHQIIIDSLINKGTTISIIFPKSSMIDKVN